MTLPGFALVTTPTPKRSRLRYVPFAVASLVAFVLLYGVMEENHSTRVSVAGRARINDVQIDPDHLPAALLQYPVTVTGQTSAGQKVSCTIRALHDKESPTCVIPLSPTPTPQAVAPSTQTPQAVAPSTQGRNDPPVTRKPPVAVPPTNSVTPTDDNHDRPDGRPTGDDSDDRDGDDRDDRDGDDRDDRDGDNRDDRDGDDRDDDGQRSVTRALVLTGPGGSDVKTDDTRSRGHDDKAKGHLDKAKR